MSVCGWNDKMAAGLKLFAEGLAIQTEKRAVEDGVAIGEVPAIEIAELKALLDSISFSEKGRGELEGIFAVTMLAHFLYQCMHENKETSGVAEVALVQAAADVSSLFSRMEKHNERELKPKYPYREAMWRLARFLKSQT